MEEEDDSDYLPLPNINSLSIPNDKAMLAVYELYKPPLTANRHLLSERNREIFAEAFNDPDQVPTLADLCVRQLAKRGNTDVPEAVRQDPRKMRVHYDSLDVDLPLRECYFVEDASFWRRVVLAKSSDNCLALKDLQDYNWRGRGLSLKYVELVEACPAALWPEKEMSELATLIRDHVYSMDIRHLQPPSEYAFRKVEREDDDLEPDITSEESGSLEISSDEPMTPEDGGEEGEEEEEEAGSTASGRKKSIGFNTTFKIIFSDDEDDSDNERRKRRQERNVARQRLRDLKAARDAEHEERRRRRSAMRKPKEPEPKKKKKRRQRIKGAFDIRVEPEPDDGDDKVLDKRNKQRYLMHLQQVKYQEEECTHIDLSFMRYFVNLVSLNLEFLGPALGRKYHQRNVLFSIKDMIRLARGLVAMEQLQIFRLRNSRLSNFKLYTVCRALRMLPLLEVVDFGYNQMTDDCGPELGILLERLLMLKSLELEYNRLDTRAMASIGQALQRSNHSRLEYLGLAHNKLSGDSLSILCNGIKGTEHVEELNVSGIETNPRIFVDQIGDLLRHHGPLRRLKMVAIPLGSKLGRKLICALVANTKVTYFDCRDCDLDVQEEFEANVAVRRNIYGETSFVTDTQRFPSIADLLEYAKTLKHPMVQKVENDMAMKKKCLPYCPTPTPSVQSVRVQSLVAEESEYDIWQMLGITKKVTKVASPVEELVKKVSSVSVVKGPFVYKPNEFNMEEFRAHVFLPGTSNRHSYFMKERRMDY
ncbi:uncharacterized protein LOC6545848 [Drosophila erecta]|uniref:Uncharacterized protein n=1 Tax=Drosophila erecta TaxID=7220 RepID=B3NEU0_DROER|nr:uncharacterized protein LOC6545848 [Drosophila erecta]EDV50213.1 uncharacterized protein Dere_GG14569 [Drosophila erecta]